MKVTRANIISISRKRRLAGAVLFVFSTSCATAGVSTNRTPQQSLSDSSLPVVSSAARVVDITDVQVRAEGPGHTSIIVTADGALVDYASFAAHTPPSLIIDLPHARDAIGQAVILPSDSPVLRVETMQLQQTPNPVVRLKFDLNHLLPYRVELTSNGLQILVSPEVSEQAPIAQEPARPEHTAKPVVSAVEPPVVPSMERVEEKTHRVKPAAPTMVSELPTTTDQPVPPSDKPASSIPGPLPVKKPVVSPIERADTEPSRAASHPAISPHAAPQNTPLSPSQKRAVSAATQRSNR
ncbi:MAG TPA: AMIN domain-containing protein, partial [Patescibacteria group bacterium]|nr:AMIN domain-containing protein [Patescibacteria group bacterium]